MSERIAKSVAAQVHSNRSALGHEARFSGHRARMTEAIAARAPAGGRGRLCLLGIGNANDVDLDHLAGRFAEIHLVDIDPEAVGRAVERAAPGSRDRLRVHAPLDASGLFDRLEDWVAGSPDLAAIAREVPAAVARVTAALPGPFDVVVSCCLLTQLQLVLLEVLTDRHPRFQELRAAVGRIHVHTLARLLAPAGGVALLMTDLVSSHTYPLDELPEDANLRALMDDLIHVGNVIHASHPGRLSAEIRRDPELGSAFATRFPVGPWLWHNGPDTTLLVYCLEITPRGR